MIVLAFDTAMAACSAAVVSFEGGQPRILAARHEARTRGHAEVLAPMISEVMEAADVPFGELDRVGVTVGPGTFTGVRVGVATARGIAVARGVPVVGLSTLKAVAAGAAKLGAQPDRAIASVFDASRGEVYVQCFSATLEALTEAQALSYEDAWRAIEAHQPILVGSGAALLPGTREGTRMPDQPSAEVIAALAAGEAIPEEAVEPLYLRAPDAKLPA